MEWNNTVQQGVERPLATKGKNHKYYIWAQWTPYGAFLLFFAPLVWGFSAIFTFLAGLYDVSLIYTYPSFQIGFSMVPFYLVGMMCLCVVILLCAAYTQDEHTDVFVAIAIFFYLVLKRRKRDAAAKDIGFFYCLHSVIKKWTPSSKKTSRKEVYKRSRGFRIVTTMYGLIVILFAVLIFLFPPFFLDDFMVSRISDRGIFDVLVLFFWLLAFTMVYLLNKMSFRYVEGADRYTFLFLFGIFAVATVAKYVNLQNLYALYTPLNSSADIIVQQKLAELVPRYTAMLSDWSLLQGIFLALLESYHVGDKILAWQKRLLEKYNTNTAAEKASTQGRFIDLLTREFPELPPFLENVQERYSAGGEASGLLPYNDTLPQEPVVCIYFETFAEQEQGVPYPFLVDAAYRQEVLRQYFPQETPAKAPVA